MFLLFLPFLFNKVFSGEYITYSWSVIIFSFGLMMVYTSSTLYHYVTSEPLKKTLRVWDHISIYLLIGGTYTPLVAKYLAFNQALVFLGVMWGVIAMGVTLKLFFTGRFKLISLGSYLVLGWMALFIVKDLVLSVPTNVLHLTAAGGLAYTLGAIFYVWKKLPYHHAIWHLFVLTGSLAHFFAIYYSF